MLPSGLPLCQLYLLPNMSQPFCGFRGDSQMCSFNSHCPLEPQIDLPLMSQRNFTSTCSKPCMWSSLTQQTYSPDSSDLAILSLSFLLCPEKSLLFSGKQLKCHFNGDDSWVSDWVKFLITSYIFLHGIYHNFIYLYLPQIYILYLFVQLFDKGLNLTPPPQQTRGWGYVICIYFVSPDLAHCLEDGRYPINNHCPHSSNKNNCNYKSLSIRDWNMLDIHCPFNL